MAVTVWKDGEKTLVPPHRLQAHLDNGYSLEEKPKAKRGRPTKEEVAAREEQSEAE